MFFEDFGGILGVIFGQCSLLFSIKKVVDFSIDFSLIFGWMTGSAGRAGRFSGLGFAR